MLLIYYWHIVFFLLFFTHENITKNCYLKNIFKCLLYLFEVCVTKAINDGHFLKFLTLCVVNDKTDCTQDKSHYNAFASPLCYV